MNAKTFLILTFFLFLGGVLFLAWRYLHLPTNFPIHRVKVVGDYQFVDPETLEKVVLPYVDKGFFNIPIQAADTALNQIPGVEKSSLKRIWPDQVDIRVMEKIAEAILPDGEIYATDGTVFKPILNPDLNQLPLFSGALEDLPAIKNFYHSAKFLLGKAGFQINYVGCDGLGSWTIGVNPNMTIILGQNHLMDKLSRFVEHYPMLKESNGGKIPTSVDLRYTLGFAVKY